MNEKEYADASAYNAGQLATGALKPDHVTSMTVEWQTRHALSPVDGKCGTNTRNSIESVTQEYLNRDKPEHPPTTPTTPGSSFYDRRATASQAHVGGPRPWTGVTGVCLHQTACLLGERPERWDSVGCHVGITRSGKVIWLHDFNKVVWHGNGWNNGTVGIEIDGLYAGVEGDPSTVWDDPSTPTHEKAMLVTPETVKATQEAVRWIISEIVKNGGAVNALVAHRQSSNSRRNDPGSSIWKKIALPLSAELGLSDGGAGFKLGNGYPIPVEWDPSRTGIKY
jgi:hypothetical protein